MKILKTIVPLFDNFLQSVGVRKEIKVFTTKHMARKLGSALMNARDSQFVVLVDALGNKLSFRIK